MLRIEGGRGRNAATALSFIYASSPWRCPYHHERKVQKPIRTGQCIETQVRLINLHTQWAPWMMRRYMPEKNGCVQCALPLYTLAHLIVTLKFSDCETFLTGNVFDGPGLQIGNGWDRADSDTCCYLRIAVLKGPSQNAVLGLHPTCKSIRLPPNKAFLLTATETVDLSHEHA